MSLNRNGGRHCCQPPLRRAKDMPVFVTWSTSAFRPSLTRSRSWLTSSGVAFHRTAPSFEEPDRSTRLRGPKVRWSFDLSGPAFWDRSPSKPKPSSVPRPFLGRPLSRPALLTDDPKTTRSRVALEEDNSSGASSRLARSEPEGSSQSCRRRSDLWSPAASACRFRLLERPGPPSRSPKQHAPLARVGEAKNEGLILWITGISGTTFGTFLDSPNPPRFGCRSVLPGLPPGRA
jgi:hypothetical protein